MEAKCRTCSATRKRGCISIAGCGKKAFRQRRAVPLARGGAHAIGNLQPACEECNLEKGARDPFEWLAERFPRLAPMFAPFVGTLPLVY